MQNTPKTDRRRFARRLRHSALAGAPFLIAASWSMTAQAAPNIEASYDVPEATQPQPQQPTYVPPPQQPPYAPPPQDVRIEETQPGVPPLMQEAEEEERETQFDNSFDLYLAPGALNVPYGGRDSIDYGASFDPGYQWGLGLGYFARPEDSAFGMGIGAFFDHAIINAEGRELDTQNNESVFRVGLELRPGVVIGERVFLNLPLRGGYAADVIVRNDDADVNHGPVFGVGLGLDVAIYRGFYIGTAVGTDLHFFRSGNDYNAYLFTWRTLLGYRF